MSPRDPRAFNPAKLVRAWFMDNSVSACPELRDSLAALLERVAREAAERERERCAKIAKTHEQRSRDCVSRGVHNGYPAHEVAVDAGEVHAARSIAAEIKNAPPAKKRGRE